MQKKRKKVMENQKNSFQIELKQLFSQKIKEAEEGKHLWQTLQKEYVLTDTSYIILLPCAHRDYTSILHAYLERFIKKKHCEKILLLSVTNMIYSFADQECVVYQKIITRKEAEELMQLYSFYEFTSNFIIVSLTEPAGRQGEYLVNSKYLTEDEAIGAVAFELYQDV